MPIHGLGPVGAKKTDDSKEELVGGGAQSSTSVIRGNGKNGKEPGFSPIDDILRQAKARDSDDPSGAGQRNIGTITIYANGFIIGEGEFQDIKDPGNAGCIDDLKKGVVPAKLEAEVKAKFGNAVSSVGISLVDKSSETFVPPKPKFSFAKSQGTSLGGGSTTVDLSTLTPCEYKLPEGDKGTTIQIITHDRKRLRLTISLQATVAAIYQHVMAVSGLASFSLLGGFPPKPMNDYGLTVQAAGLAGASVTQKK